MLEMEVNGKRVLTETEQDEDANPLPVISGKTNLVLTLADADTGNSTQVKVQLFQKYDQVYLVKEMTEAAVKALVSLGMVEQDTVELETQIHTIAYRKRS